MARKQYREISNYVEDDRGFKAKKRGVAHPPKYNPEDNMAIWSEEDIMTGRTYTYDVTLQPTGDSGTATGISFRHTNHDDLARITAFVRERCDFEPDAACAAAIGLKLLTQTLLDRKDDPLFGPLRTSLFELIGRLKALPQRQ